MARYKPNKIKQGKLISVFFDDQLIPGTFEHTLNRLIDQDLDLTIFDNRYKNDETGAPAYNPRALLKVILFAYSRGITSSRQIARSCEDHVIFMALTGDTRPHFTTIADFVATMDQEITPFFRDVLLVCDNMGLIGKEMFAIDGCKLPSNAGKQWSGTKTELTKKAAKMEAAIGRILERHRGQDAGGDGDVAEKERRYVASLQKQVAKVKKWLSKNDDKPGKCGKAIKSNITDNESAKMKTSHGVIQGYTGVTAVDSKHQIIVHAEAHGQGQEHDLLKPMVEGARENFHRIGKETDVFNKAKLSADSGYHSEENMKMLSQQGIDGYVADNLFRKRDPRFVDSDRYKERHKKERAQLNPPKGLFSTKDFIFAEDFSHCICPAGKKLYRSGGNVAVRNFQATKFKGPKSACVGCVLRRQCLRHPERTEIRQVAYFHGRSEQGKETFTERMKRKIDSTVGRVLYGMRLATAEPPFAHIRHIMGLDRFSHRGKRKVNTQWNLFCIVHNMKKVHRYANGVP